MALLRCFLSAWRLCESRWGRTGFNSPILSPLPRDSDLLNGVLLPHKELVHIIGEFFLESQLLFEELAAMARRPSADWPGVPIVPFPRLGSIIYNDSSLDYLNE